MTPDDWLRKHAGTPETIELGLESCIKALSLCDLLPLPFQVFTVAGTNGKGSTVAILDSILSVAGLLTGRYSSPHLIRFNERILVAQDEQADALIIKAFEFIKEKSDDIPLSYFEYATIASLVIFAQQGVDVALLEVGLGGRLDACNAVNADVMAITSIALDHQDWLGNDLESIGFEKAGIMRAHKPCILGSTNLPKSINQHALYTEALAIQLGSEYSFTQNDDKWVWKDDTCELEFASPSLLGATQIQNAAGAIAMLRHSQFWPLKTQHIDKGLQNIKLAGRLQKLSVLNRDWVLDVAHNPASMQVLCDYLYLHNKVANNSKISVVFAMLADKDLHSCIALLKPFVTSWYIAELDSPRSLSVGELESHLLSCGIKPGNIHAHNSVALACTEAHKKTHHADQLVVCGSFYTVGEALSYLWSV